MLKNVKNVLVVTALAVSGIVSAQNVKAYKNLYFGMTKQEAKTEFKTNKDSYTTAQIGGFEYRLYVQNNKFDQFGGLNQIGFVAKGSGLTGVFEAEAKDRLRDLIKFAKANNYTTDGIAIGASEFEYDRNGEYTFYSPNKDKFIKLVFFPNGDKYTFLSLWVGKYDETKKEEVYADSDF